MNYFLLALTTFGLSAQSISTKQYNKNSTNAPTVFTVMSALSALLVFLVSSGFRLHFNGQTLFYALCFAVSYSAAMIGMAVAVANGPLSISSLIQSYSLIVPTLYGILFLDESVKVTTVVGFVLLVVSLFAVNYVKGEGGVQKISKKWIIAIIFTFIGNGMCSTIGKIQQVASGGKYKSELMISALLIVALMLLPVSVFSEKNKIKTSIKSGWCWAGTCGIANGITNLIVLILVGKMPVSLVFPVISAGSIVLSSLVAVLLYKEKLTKIQFIGVAIGVASIVFLNI